MKSRYEDRVEIELLRWEAELLRRPGSLASWSKSVQTRIHEAIPDKVNEVITTAVKTTVKGVLGGIEFIPKAAPLRGLSLQERDEQARVLLERYKKIAAAEGAGAGMGGILLGVVDFGALLAIKMKFLFELAHVYGYDTHDVRERLFLLHVFQLAFSGAEGKGALFRRLKQWEQVRASLPQGPSYLESIDWEQFQREYRDAIDLRKLLQLVPGIGAIVGAWANYGLVEELGEAGRNSYRMRLLQAH